MTLAEEIQNDPAAVAEQANGTWEGEQVTAVATEGTVKTEKIVIAQVFGPNDNGGYDIKAVGIEGKFYTKKFGPLAQANLGAVAEITYKEEQNGPYTNRTIFTLEIVTPTTTETPAQSWTATASQTTANTTGNTSEETLPTVAQQALKEIAPALLAAGVAKNMDELTTQAAKWAEFVAKFKLVPF